MQASAKLTDESKLEASGRRNEQSAILLCYNASGMIGMPQLQDCKFP